MILPRLLFVHVPKTGGISLFRALRKIYTEPKTIRFTEGSIEDKNKYLTMTHEEVRNYNFITGHLTLPLFTSKPIEDYLVMTVVREPIDREISAYFYIKSWKEHPLHNKVKPLDLFQYLDMLDSQKMRNPQCWFLSEDWTFEAARKIIDKKVHLSAPIEYLNEFCAALFQKHNIPEFELTMANKTSFRVGIHELHPDIIHRLEDMLQDDIKIYNYIKQNFEEKILPTLILKDKSEVI